MAKIIFMGTPQYAKVILEQHLKHHDVVAVVTQPDRAVGRKRTMTSPPVKVLADEYNIECLQPQKLDNSYVKKLQSYGADFTIVAAYGQILSAEILNVATPINLHASLLPKYRGASPVQECLLNLDIYTGVTAMLMEEGLDSGPVLGYRAFKLQNETLTDLMNILSDEAAALSVNIIDNFNKINPLQQNNALKSYCKKVKSSDGLSTFTDAKKLCAKFRAYYGWPGIYLESGLKLKEIELHEYDSQNAIGEILSTEENVIIGCKKGSIIVKELQPANKKSMDIKSYLNGKRLNVGDTLL